MGYLDTVKAEIASKNTKEIANSSPAAIIKLIKSVNEQNAAAKFKQLINILGLNEKDFDISSSHGGHSKREGSFVSGEIIKPENVDRVEKEVVKALKRLKLENVVFVEQDTGELMFKLEPTRYDD